MKRKQINAAEVNEEVFHSYAEVKKQALENPLLRKNMRIGDVKILDANRIDYRGTELQLSDNAFRSLIKRLGVPSAFQNKVSTLLGPQAKLHLLNAMRSAISAHSNKSLMFIGNPTTGKIVGVTDDVSMLSAESFFELVENSVDKYKLDVKQCSIGSFGNVNIQAVSAHTAGITGLTKSHRHDESYNPGVSFSNSLFRGTELGSYTYRLICSNGMVGMHKNDVIAIGGFDSKELKRFYERINELAGNNFISSNYSAQVMKAINCNASLGELKMLAESMVNQSAAQPGVVNRFVPYFDCVKKYEALNIHVEHLTTQQLANAKTNVNLWDAINGTTDFATHKVAGVDMSSANRILLQGAAGTVLNKTHFDTEMLMPSIG